MTTSRTFFIWLSSEAGKLINFILEFFEKICRLNYRPLREQPSNGQNDDGVPKTQHNRKELSGAKRLPHCCHLWSAARALVPFASVRSQREVQRVLLGWRDGTGRQTYDSYTLRCSQKRFTHGRLADQV